MKTSKIAALAALGAAFAFLATRARAYAPATPSEPYGPEYEDWPEMIDASNDDSALSDPRVRAFLAVIRTLEHDARDNPYTTFYGRAQFSNFANHPVLTGELRGVPLSREMCINAGFADGICVSTAAGAYQFTVPTWNDVRGQSPRLSDFSPESQDKAAVRLLRKIGALHMILVDDIDGALRKASTRWASLPYSTAKQNPKSISYALSVYNRNLEA